MGSLPQARCLVLFAASMLALSCGGGRDVDGDTPAAPAPVPSIPTPPLDVPPTPAPLSSDQPVWIPPGTFACALGPGVKDTACDTEPPVFADRVNAAVDRVIAEQLDLFPDRDITSRVRNEEAVHLAVIRILQAQGLCAGWDFTDLQVRNSNDFSEHYDLFDARGFLHQDPADRVRSTCRPADFPISAADRIDSVRVGFYGIDCPPGVNKPPNSSGRFPVGCLGHVTATPKDKFFNDVDPRAHGPYITWELEQRRAFVGMRDDDVTAFNKNLRAAEPGSFALCATIQGKRGCLAADVVAAN